MVIAHDRLDDNEAEMLTDADRGRKLSRSSVVFGASRCQLMPAGETSGGPRPQGPPAISACACVISDPTGPRRWDLEQPHLWCTATFQHYDNGRCSKH